MVRSLALVFKRERGCFWLRLSTLLEIEAAAEALPLAQQEEWVRFLTALLRPSESTPGKARLVREGDDILLEGPPGAPPMTPENVRQMLEDWP